MKRILAKAFSSGVTTTSSSNGGGSGSLSLTQRYVKALQTHPMLTNMTSALVLMVAGDIVAQEVEIHYLGVDDDNDDEDDDDAVDSEYKDIQRSLSTKNDAKSPSHLAAKEGSVSDDHPVHIKRRLSFRQYGTLSPNVGEIQRRNSQITVARKNPGTVDETATATKDGADATKEGVVSTSLSQWTEKVHTEWDLIDWFRISTMSFWSVSVYTPYWVALFKLYDRMMPGPNTPLKIGTRVASNFVLSIPLNIAFYGYGCFVHHVTEWISLIKEWKYQVPDASLRQILHHNPFDGALFWSTYRLKLESELRNTIIVSGVMWIPINAFNFTIMPPHLRPLILTFFTVFWNCYLSLSQHRDAKLDT